MKDILVKYQEFWPRIDNLHERLTYILWRLDAKKDISEEDHDLLEYLYKAGDMGDIPHIDTKPKDSEIKSRLYTFMRQSGSTKRGGTDIDFLTV